MEAGDDISSHIESGVPVPEEIKVAHRPYWCKIHGCGKKYKNLNGLKYHARISHPNRHFKTEVKGHVGANLDGGF